jgi:gentisate 1,2-dioxygenase
VPNWTRHQHRNHSASDEAILFSVHDTPVLRALGLYRED